MTAPGLGAGPEFIRTTLPADAVTGAVQTPYPVLLNSAVTEIPADGTAPVDREDGPTPGSRAVAGGGGGYLSNEVAYRSNRLRGELAPLLPGGHLHTPVLTGLPHGSAGLDRPRVRTQRERHRLGGPRGPRTRRRPPLNALSPAGPRRVTVGQPPPRARWRES